MEPSLTRGFSSIYPSASEVITKLVPDARRYSRVREKKLFDYWFPDHSHKNYFFNYIEPIIFVLTKIYNILD